MKSNLPTIPVVVARIAPMPTLARLALFLIAAPALLWAAESPPADKPATEAPPVSALQEAIDQLKLPGITIHAQGRYVDVTAEVCLAGGMLELIACTRDSKEHESIIVVDAKPMHIHAALLLLGTKPGTPARRIPPNDQHAYWIDIPPAGGEVGVFLAFKDAEGKWTERPISDFIRHIESQDEDQNPDEPRAKFPTHHFLFAGSLLVNAGDGPRRYICDETGNLISITTFGDELLCLAEVHGHDNHSLNWEINSKHLPALGTKCLLRLRPVLPPLETE